MTLEDILIRVFATVLLLYDAFLMYQRIRDGLEEIRKENEQKEKEK